MSTARKAALRRILISEGINPEVLKAALDTEIIVYMDMIEEEYEEDRLERTNTEIHKDNPSKFLEAYFLLRQALD